MEDIINELFEPIENETNSKTIRQLVDKYKIQQKELSIANDKLKKIEEYINKNNVYKYNEKGICIESPYIDWQCISRDISKIIKGED